MLYPSPIIEHIDTMLEAVHGREEFKVTTDIHRGFTLINYKYVTHDTFSREHKGWELLRECRGIAFNTDTGKIISRPLHKFFNYGEMPETQWSNIQGAQFYAAAKYDGSMVRPIPVKNGFVLATRGGYSEQAQRAQVYLSSDDILFINACINEGKTPIYEFIGPNNPHVLNYSENRLQLLAVRDNVSGVYRTDTALMGEPISFDLSYTKAIQELEGIEGFVLTEASGQYRMKLKTQQYVILHRCKDSAAHEHSLLEIMFTSLWDDFYSMYPDSERKRYLLNYNVLVMTSLRSATLLMNQLLESTVGLNKKEFAMKLRALGKIESEGPILFRVFEGKATMTDAVWEYAGRCSKDVKGVEKMRWLIGSHNFSQEKQEEVE